MVTSDKSILQSHQCESYSFGDMLQNELSVPERSEWTEVLKIVVRRKYSTGWGEMVSNRKCRFYIKRHIVFRHKFIPRNSLDSDIYKLKHWKQVIKRLMNACHV